MEIKLYTTSNVDEIEDSISQAHFNTFMSNPFLYEDAPIQLRAEENGKVLGSVYAFPLEIVTQGGDNFIVCAGSTLTVKPENRGMGLAKRMTLKRLELTKDKIAIASGLSNMSLQLFRKLGFSVFLTKRYIYLKNSRPVVEMIFKIGLLLRMFTSIANGFVRLQTCFLERECKNNMKGISIEEVKEVPNEVPEIVALDNALFRENHTLEWFKWVLKGGFNQDNRSKQHLFVLKKNAEIIGFFMTKERFYEQASSRGFRNVVLGSIIEWAVRPGCDISVEKLILCALLSFGKHVDAVEMCSSYENINKYLRKHFIINVGESNFAIKALDESPLALYPEYKEICNWRIRPAASDNSFN